MILVISYPGEEHTLGVVHQLEQRGREVLLLDLADFPAQSGLQFSWNGERDYSVHTPQGQMDLRKAKVGWWRRVRPFTIDSAISNSGIRQFAESETAQAVNGILEALPCTWVNNRSADTAAHFKPYQWEMAYQVGLKMPPTLVTTLPEQARTFIHKWGVGKTVFKPFLATLEAWRETRLVEERDLALLPSVTLAPVIFQPYIEGVDLRITIVGEQIFAAEIDARGTSYPVDMRMVVGEANVQPVELPPSLCRRLLRFMKRLGLSYGAIDMRRTDRGDYYFLEVNPAGQWLFVEQRTALPITEAVAAFLIACERPQRNLV